MNVQKTSLVDAVVIDPQVFGDHRGFFLESYSKRDYEKAGIANYFVQDNHSLSREKGVLRGLHFQLPPFAQAKLIRAIHGSIYDVIVDLRKGSPSYGKWEGFTLTGDNFKTLFVPAGFAHGFCTLEENTEVLYKTDNFYSPEHDSGIIWNDADLAIDWPVDNPILSDKDQKLPSSSQLDSPF